MKKKYRWNSLFLQKDFFTKIFRAVYIAIYILLLATSSSFGKSSYSPNAKFSIYLNNATVQQIFEEIQKNNGEPSVAGLESIAPQTKGITGKVTDSNDFPLPGVSIVVKGTTIGTVTGVDGQFSLMVPNDAKTFVFSFIGMLTQEIAIGSKTIFNIILQEQTVGLEEVVAVGYGTQKKASVVGAISQVTNAALVKSASPSITNAIAGKLSGVLTMQQTGQPGSNNSEIIIRGLSSWSGSQPLVMVDGIERDFSSLDPGQINTISVLKDASATAVFGAKGANGVIIVTTKRGTLGKPQFSFSNQTGIQMATRIPDHISSNTTMSMWNVALKNEARYSTLVSDAVLQEYKSPSTPLKSLQYPDNNYFDLIMKPFAPTTNSNLSVQGGTDFVKYFCSLAYLYEGDFFKSYRDGYNNTSNTNNKFN